MGLEGMRVLATQLNHSIPLIKATNSDLPNQLSSLNLSERKNLLKNNLVEFSAKFSDVFVQSCLERDPILMSTTNKVRDMIDQLLKGEIG